MLSPKSIGEGSGTYGKGVETFLAGSVPNLISQHAVLQTALLCEESGSDRRLLVGLELVRDLEWQVVVKCGSGGKGLRTNRSTIDDFPTAASPVGEQECQRSGTTEQCSSRSVARTHEGRPTSEGCW